LLPKTERTKHFSIWSLTLMKLFNQPLTTA
jgi:hypothetical protein